MTTPTRPDITNSIKALAKSAHHEQNFSPSVTQEKIKARFFRRLEEMSHIMDRETVLASPQLIEQLAGTTKIHTWLGQPAFAAWFLDTEYITDTISSLQAQAINVLSEILTAEGVFPSDRLKAAKLLLELGDQFPGRKSEVRFLDDRLNQMSESETDKEIAKLQQQLRLGEDDDNQ